MPQMSGGWVADLPSGTVTFLFTDLEDSTRLWEQHPDAMRVALARHDALVAAAISANDGSVVKTTGDGFHTAFWTAESAIRAAIDAQRALSTESWDATGPMRVRMGLHTGTSGLRDGDYYGSVLNRAARLMSGRAWRPGGVLPDDGGTPAGRVGDGIGAA